MSTPTRLVSLGAAVLLIFGLSACTAEPEEAAPLPTSPVVQLGAPGEPNRTLSPDEAAGLGSPTYVEQDVLFVRDMLHHHSQAIQMTGYVDDRTTDEDIRLLAERMDVSQTDEITQLETWLQTRGEPVRDPDDSHAHTAGARATPRVSAVIDRTGPSRPGRVARRAGLRPGFRPSGAGGPAGDGVPASPRRRQPCTMGGYLSQLRKGSS